MSAPPKQSESSASFSWHYLSFEQLSKGDSFKRYTIYIGIIFITQALWIHALLLKIVEKFDFWFAVTQTSEWLNKLVIFFSNLNVKKKQNICLWNETVIPTKLSVDNVTAH